jgi:hypothetical protein
MSLQETLTSLLNIVLLSTGNKATIAVVHHQIINANFVRLVDINYGLFFRSLISQKRKLAFELIKAEQRF